MAVTLKEVAERAGVSRSAVSRTFTEGASVSPKMRRKVDPRVLRKLTEMEVLAWAAKHDD